VALSGKSLVPPVANKKPVITNLHGEERKDDYSWLRDKDDPAVSEYLEAENQYAKQTLKHTETFQQQLYDEMLARIKETDLSVPFTDNGYEYFYRTEEGKQYEIYCRRAATGDASEEVLLDLNALAEGKAFMSLGALTVSDDNNFLAYTTDETGFRQYTLHVKDLRSGELLPDSAERVGAVVWCADNATVFYTEEDEETKRQYRLIRHVLGTHDHELVYEESDELFYISAGRTRDRKLIMLSSGSHTTSEVQYIRSDEPDANWTMVLPRVQDREYDVGHRNGLFYLRINDTGRNFRLVSVSVKSPVLSTAVEIIPHDEHVMLEDFDLFAGHYVVQERRQGLPGIRIVEYESGNSRSITFPEPVYEAYTSVNIEWDTRQLRYGYQSLVTPSSVYEYDLDTAESKLLKQTEILGGYDASLYESERRFATATDGTQIPVSIVSRKDRSSHGDAPTLLIGYGSYGWAYPVTFSSTRLSLLDRGVTFAIAHIRGGGEMGKPWHDQGRMMSKLNTFTDFIDVARFLNDAGYTSTEKLIVEGGSAGGLLVGAVANLRPDLFKAVVSHVPFVDVLNTMLDASLPLTVGEYEEWGNPNEEPAYRYMGRYCPYTNLSAKAYPTMLVKTSLNDSQVMYWEPAKYVAKLRTLKTDSNPLLLVTNMDAGHGGASGRYDRLHELALDYAFMLDQWGLLVE
jgi:oligopeptidase B